jgi:hypothetical protein
MTLRKHTHGLSIHEHGGVSVIDIGELEVWDGAELSLLRDTFATLMRGGNCRAIAVNMSTVQCIPSGFFGALMNCFDEGLSVQLIDPRPIVKNMRWFRQFFVLTTGNTDLLKDAPAFCTQHTIEPETLPIAAAEPHRNAIAS